MGMDVKTIGLPIFVMAMIALMSGGQIANGSGIFGVNNSPPGSGNPNAGGGPAVTCTQDASVNIFSRTPCFSSAIPASGSLTCIITNPQPGQNANWCYVIFGCQTNGINNNQGVGCIIDPTRTFFITILYQNAVLYFGSSGVVSVTPGSSNVQQGVFGVQGDWTDILAGLVALASVAAVTVFAIGLDSEAVHLIFEVGGLMVIWAILTLASGWGSVSSFWSQLDAAYNTIPLGTTMYGFLSLIYLLGVLKSISRGGS